MLRSLLCAVLVTLATPCATLAAWGDVDTGFFAGGWMNLWSNVWGPIPGALMVDFQDRIVTVAQDGTDTVRLIRTFDDGAVDTSFGFLGSASLSVPGALSVRVVRLLPGASNGDFVIAAWVESGLPTKPTACFRTVGATASNG